MICLRCGHYIKADSEMTRAQDSGSCQCDCHMPKEEEMPNAPGKEKVSDPKTSIARQRKV